MCITFQRYGWTLSKNQLNDNEHRNGLIIYQQNKKCELHQNMKWALKTDKRTVPIWKARERHVTYKIMTFQEFSGNWGPRATKHPKT